MIKHNEFVRSYSYVLGVALLLSLAWIVAVKSRTNTLDERKKFSIDPPPRLVELENVPRAVEGLSQPALDAEAQDTWKLLPLSAAAAIDRDRFEVDIALLRTQLKNQERERIEELSDMTNANGAIVKHYFLPPMQAQDRQELSVRVEQLMHKYGDVLQPIAQLKLELDERLSSYLYKKPLAIRASYDPNTDMFAYFIDIVESRGSIVDSEDGSRTTHAIGTLPSGFGKGLGVPERWAHLIAIQEE